MSKPTIEKKFLMETNPFGRRVMTNVAEVVAFMAAKATAEGKKVPTLKYLTAGKTLCEKQIGNLDEVVQWMYDNWANDADKGEGEGKIPAPTYAYATEGVKPLAIPYIENMTEVVESIFKDMEEKESGGEGGGGTGHDRSDHDEQRDEERVVRHVKGRQAQEEPDQSAYEQSGTNPPGALGRFALHLRPSCRGRTRRRRPSCPRSPWSRRCRMRGP